jgi:gamma-glutamyltranspeptidase
VSSAHPVATAAGVEILRRGGNVVDAAVAVSFALGVAEPDASGIGGYGQMLIATAGEPEPILIEFMSRAPEEATLSNAALLQNGRYPDDGPVLAMVPGTVAAMELAWRKHGSGKLPWAALLEPAIRAAEQGYVVSDGLASTLARERAHFLKYDGSRALFFPAGEPLRAGDTLRNPDLAWTLRQIAEGGARAFYTGEVARRMVTDLRGKGNAIRLSDLARYYPAERTPVTGVYRGYSVYSSAPPASGGATLVAQLNLLEHHASPRPYAEDAATAHAMIEAWKLVPSGRGRIADPGLWPVDLDAFTSEDSAAVRWRCFRPDRALTPADIRGDSVPCAREPPRTSLDDTRSAWSPPEPDACWGDHVCHEQGTTAFAVADGAGNAVSVTQTLGTWGGNFYVTPGLGFLYNDKLTSYGSDPDQYGARLPFARHGSSLAPTLVFTGAGATRRPVLATGAAGNAWITSVVYSIVTGVLDHRLPVQQAIESPRFLVGGRGGGGAGAGGAASGAGSGDQAGFVIQVEYGFAPEVTRRLRAVGHELVAISLPGELRMGYAAAITIGEGRVTAGADPRRSGAAGAVECGEAAVACPTGIRRR